MAATKKPQGQRPDKNTAPADPLEETEEDRDILELTEATIMVDSNGEEETVDLSDIVDGNETALGQANDFMDEAEDYYMTGDAEMDSESGADIIDLTEEAPVDEEDDDIIDLFEEVDDSEDEAIIELTDVEEDETDDILDLTEEVPAEDPTAAEPASDTELPSEDDDIIDLTESVESENEDTMMMDFADTVELSDIVDDNQAGHGDGSLRELRETESAAMDETVDDEDEAEDDVLDEDSLVTDYEDGEDTGESAAFSDSLDTELESALDIDRDASFEEPGGGEGKISVHVRNRREIDRPEDFNAEAMEQWQEKVLKNMAASDVAGRITDEQLEAALVKAIKEVYSEKLEAIIEDVVEKTIVDEIEKLKKLVYGGGDL
ncbi:MAG: hypothetical protein SWH68_01365 [Thermodesulfobacteriota bacterium]|nr:hypothetical protein [Thermodesulfobacteriota bacterium]